MEKITYVWLFSCRSSVLCRQEVERRRQKRPQLRFLRYQQQHQHPLRRSSSNNSSSCNRNSSSQNLHQHHPLKSSLWRRLFFPLYIHASSSFSLCPRFFTLSLNLHFPHSTFLLYIITSFSLNLCCSLHPIPTLLSFITFLPLLISLPPRPSN